MTAASSSAVVTGIDGFECRHLHARVTTTSCAARAKAGRDPTCAKCQTGREHRAGRTPEVWPDGTPVVRVKIRARSEIPLRRRVAACRR